MQLFIQKFTNINSSKLDLKLLLNAKLTIKLK